MRLAVLVLTASGLIAGLACAQQSTYENSGIFAAPPEIPPNIDAINFINDGQFVINLTNQIWFTPPFQAPYPFEMQDTRMSKSIPRLLIMNQISMSPSRSWKDRRPWWIRCA